MLDWVLVSLVTCMLDWILLFWFRNSLFDNINLLMLQTQVFVSFASATVKIRASGIGSFLRLNSDKDTNGNISQYDFGLALKETMLNLGPTFIKGKFF